MDRLLAHEGSGSFNLFSKRYKLVRVLGSGSFSEVKLAKHVLTGLKVAVKIMNRQNIRRMDVEEKVKREIKILRFLMHPHIVRLYDVVETRTDIYLVMEYGQSGDLFDYLVERGKLQEGEARSLFQQIISGVEYCHRNLVVHRDLKPENLLLDSNCHVKITDFGLSNIMRDGHFLKTNCGSPNYAAPEVLCGNLYAGPEVDVWSCGVILYALLCGTLPFDDCNSANLLKKIRGGKYALPSNLPPGARDLIPRMLVVDPMNRITIPEIRQHPWFQVRLPRYLALSSPDILQQAKKIDEEIVQEVIRMGFDRDFVIGSLCNRIQNEATVSYYLLLDNRSPVSNNYLGAEFQETIECGSGSMHPNEPSSPPARHHLPGSSDDQVMDMKLQHPNDRKWELGLQFGAPPYEIMEEVLKALRELNVFWKKIGHYNTKCRWIPGGPGSPVGMGNDTGHSNSFFGEGFTNIEHDGFIKLANVVKFEVQLYTTPDKKYLLDLQRLQGPQFLFLDLCAALREQLRVFLIRKA